MASNWPAELLFLLASSFQSPVDVLSLGLVSRRFHRILLSNLKDARNTQVQQLLSHFVTPVVDLDATEKRQVRFYTVLPNRTAHGEWVVFTMDDAEGIRQAMKRYAPELFPKKNDNLLVDLSPHPRFGAPRRGDRNAPTVKPPPETITLDNPKAQAEIKHIFQRRTPSCVAKKFFAKFHGPLTNYYYSGNSGVGKKHSEEFYNNGKIEGDRKMYSREGTLSQTIPYQNGEIEGCLLTYFENGKISSRAHYREGKLEGLCEYYEDTPEGLVVTARTTYKNNEYDGDAEKWYPSTGILRSRFSYRANVLEKAQQWYPNGNLETTCQYQETWLNGIFERYYLTGILQEKTEYKLGKRDGFSERYDELGNQIEKALFKDNEAIKQ